MNSKSVDMDVAVIGAGPYGLSAGMHLKAKGIATRVFGEPMDFWASKMPEGMLLRSPRVASNISDADRAFTLEAYEAASKKKPCAPVPLDTFVEYGKWFPLQLGLEPGQEIGSTRRQGSIRRSSLPFRTAKRCGQRAW